MLELTDADLLARLNNKEDISVERKSSGDSRDWIKTVVAFANSAPVGQPAVLFIGVKDDGTVEGTANLDSLQKTFSKKIRDAHPPIQTFSKVLRHEGKEFLAVIIPGSLERPHFAGHSYVRVGSETRDASEEQFKELIAQRTSKTRYILEWKDKEITIVFYGPGGRVDPPKEWTVTGCGQFFVTLQSGTRVESFVLSKVEISHNDVTGRMKLEVRTYI